MVAITELVNRLKTFEDTRNKEMIIHMSLGAELRCRRQRRNTGFSHYGCAVIHPERFLRVGAKQDLSIRDGSTVHVLQHAERSASVEVPVKLVWGDISFTCKESGLRTGLIKEFFFFFPEKSLDHEHKLLPTIFSFVRSRTRGFGE